MLAAADSEEAESSSVEAKGAANGKGKGASAPASGASSTTTTSTAEAARKEREREELRLAALAVLDESSEEDPANVRKEFFERSCRELLIESRQIGSTATEAGSGQDRSSRDSSD